VVVDSKSNDITDSNKTEKESAIEFLENRGMKFEWKKTKETDMMMA